MNKTLIVTDAGDKGAGTLRAQIDASDPGDTIIFDPNLKGQTITLASTLVVDQPITIDGADSHVTISGNHKVTVFDVNFRGPGTAVIQHLLSSVARVSGRWASTAAPRDPRPSTPREAPVGTRQVESSSKAHRA